jgi:hypothetical protein
MLVMGSLNRTRRDSKSRVSASSSRTPTSFRTAPPYSQHEDNPDAYKRHEDDFDDVESGVEGDRNSGSCYAYKECVK